MTIHVSAYALINSHRKINIGIYNLLHTSTNKCDHKYMVQTKYHIIYIKSCKEYNMSIYVFYRLDLSILSSLCFFLLERLVVSRGTACRNSITPMLICRVKKKITLVILYIKTRVIEVKPAVPLLTIYRRGHILYSLITSLRILYIGGWNHSDLELSISLLHLRI